MNAERQRESLPALIWDEDLFQVAQAHSRYMSEQGEISHSGSGGAQPHDRVQAAGIYATKIAENVARDLNVISAHTSLMESVYHRENILDPELTHGAAAIVRTGKYIYVTEEFIRALEPVTLPEARRMLLSQMSAYRANIGKESLILSKSLSEAAQSHIEVQEKLNSLSPPLLMNLMAKKQKGAVRINIFTSPTVTVPEEVHPNLSLDVQSVGIGFKRIRGKLCENGCYLVTLIFGPPTQQEESR